MKCPSGETLFRPAPVTMKIQSIKIVLESGLPVVTLHPEGYAWAALTNPGDHGTVISVYEGTGPRTDVSAVLNSERTLFLKPEDYYYVILESIQEGDPNVQTCIVWNDGDLIE